MGASVAILSSFSMVVVAIGNVNMSLTKYNVVVFVGTIGSDAIVVKVGFGELVSGFILVIRFGLVVNNILDVNFSAVVSEKVVGAVEVGNVISGNGNLVMVVI